MASEERYLTTKQAAEIMGVSVSTIRRWIYSGVLDAVKPGGTPNSQVRIRPRDLENIGGIIWDK